MGNLTGDMRRLRNEISVLRGSRESLIKELARVAKDRKNAVAGMRADFRDAHAEMARNSRAERVAFLSGLRRTVSAMRKRFADDNAGARNAWFGPSPYGFAVVEQEVSKHEEVETGAVVEQEVSKHEEVETGAVEEQEVSKHEEVETGAVEEQEVSKYEEVEAGAGEEQEVFVYGEAETGAGAEQKVSGFKEEEKESETIEEVFMGAEIETGKKERQVTEKVTPPKGKPKGKKR